MSSIESWAPPLRRLRDELLEGDVHLPRDPWRAATVVDELDHARRPPVHERRTPLYGSLVLGDPQDRTLCTRIAELIDLEGQTVESARRFADGRSSFLVRSPDRPLALACFERSVQYEADLIDVQRTTGAFIVQRTVMGTARLFTHDGVVQWTGREWSRRLNARWYASSLTERLAGVPAELLDGLLELGIHWLSPGRVGATLLLVPGDGPQAGLDLGAAIPAPDLRIGHRAHYSALFASLLQTDLATTVTPDGRVHDLGVALLASPEAERLIPPHDGMRHTSARRYTYDHPTTLALVVSEDGPVTLFAGGAPVVVCAANGGADTTERRPAAEEVTCPRCGSTLVLGASGDEPCGPDDDRCPACLHPQGLAAGRVVLRVSTAWERRPPA
ncbi:MAG: hypothetical protein AAFZ07_21665 [Actinomycetota bacterium]